MKKISIVLCLVTLMATASAQKIHFGCPKVFKSSKDVFDTSNQNCLKHIRVNVFKDNIVAIDNNNSSLNISFNSVWGYRRRNDYPIRIVSNSHYTLLRTTPVYVYRQGSIKTTHYFFSVDLDGQLYSLTKKQLRKTFIDDSTYIAIVKHKNIKKFF